MIYDLNRTKEVVNRLVLLGNNLRAVLILINAVQFGTLLGILGALVSGGLWIVFALIGALAGSVIGIFIANSLATILEWMAQILISRQPEE